MIVELGHAGLIERIEVDTAHFKGNYPDICSVHGAMITAGTRQSIITQSMFWEEVLLEHKLGPDAVHVFEADRLSASAPVSHVRLAIHPDGGISRFRVFGRLVS